MSDILLVKQKLPDGFIDLSVGEPHLLQSIFTRIFNVDWQKLYVEMNDVDLTYPSPAGYQPLVSLLEKKYQGKVLITNGAKQALGAIFWALKSMGYNEIKMYTPFWALIPPLAHMHALTCTYENDFSKKQDNPYLALSPNNPDNTLLDLASINDSCKASGVPFIHDAAYYTEAYLPSDYPRLNIGDAQIFSISKMLGFSGLRLGFAVFRNDKLFELAKSYIEAMTVGVSNLSQKSVFHLLSRMNDYPTLASQFHGEVFYSLQEAKTICKKINKDVLEVPENFEKTSGMFGWFKKGKSFDPIKSKVNVVDGKHFGDDSYIRMNICFHKKTMEDIVNRLNN